jgi:PucR C-terminal helix-turn-helix domain
VPEAVGKLVTDIEAELDTLVDGIVVRIREEVPDFRRLPASTLARAVRGNVARALAALRDLRPPTPDELERAAQVGRERAEQGLSVDAVLHAYRISISAVWSRFGELARERGTNVTSVLAFSETLWLWGDAVMEVVGNAHREVELQLAREEQQRRDAFVLAVLLGTIDAAELSRESGGYGLDPEREYVAFRARSLESGATPRRLAADGLTTALDHDLVGLSTNTATPIPGVVVGVGPSARLAALPASFAMASRALQTALAFGQEGVFSLADLSIRPAILADEALGAAFTGRHLEPLQALGRLGAELEDTLRVWFEQEMRVEETAKALHVHPNTLRHRLRRFEETTGASLRRPGDLIELWWALERRRLSGARERTAPAPPVPARSPTRGSSAAPAAGPV